MTPQERGFTLLELAIVMLVLTILAAGVLVPLTTSIESRRYEATQKLLEEATEALIGYAMSHPTIPCTCDYLSSGALNGLASTCPIKTPCPPSNPYAPNNSGTYTMIRHYLPCPDKTSALGDPSNLPNDGIEDRATSPGLPECDTYEGNFPWATLGVGNADAWGNRLRYRVDSVYSDHTMGFSSASAPTDGIQICNQSGCPTNSIVAAQLPAVILSFGKNGWGAINSNTPIGTSGVPQASPTSADELENTNWNPINKDPIYVSHAPTEASSAPTEFDDLVVWLSAPVLAYHACPSGCP